MTEERNVKARLRKALDVLDGETQSRLAVAFVRHACTYLNATQRQLALELTDTLDAYLDGMIDIFTVDKRFKANLANEWSESTDGADARECSSWHLSCLGGALQALLLTCCQPELKAEGLAILPKYQPDAFTVALEIADCCDEVNEEHSWQLRCVIERHNEVPKSCDNGSGESAEA